VRPRVTPAGVSLLGLHPVDLQQDPVSEPSVQEPVQSLSYHAPSSSNAMPGL
jgi:hypothetical protein